MTAPDQADVDHLDHLVADSVALRAATQRGPAAPVPTCPGWTVAGLLGHTSGAHRWATHVLDHGPAVQQRDLPDPPEDLDELLRWFDDGLAQLCDRFASIDPAAPVWTPTAGVTGSRWWRRKIAVETALHRWDAEHALGVARPIAALVAGDGVDEFVTEFLPHLVAHVEGARRAACGWSRST